jgi:equilibrative nucleoside transporter 1/2/3
MTAFNAGLDTVSPALGPVGATMADSGKYIALFVPLSFLNFNLFDFLGRIAAGAVHVKADGGRCVPLWSILRIVFVPLFLLCHFKDNTPFFKSDAFPITIMAVFAFTNGLVGSLCMMYGPLRVASESSGTAAQIMAFSLTSGLAIGSCLSFALVAVM